MNADEEIDEIDEPVNEAPRGRLRRAGLVALGLGALVLPVVGIHRWSEATVLAEHDRELAGQLAQIQADFERCAAGDAEPDAYADAMIRRQLTPGQFERSFAECFDQREQSLSQIHGSGSSLEDSKPLEALRRVEPELCVRALVTGLECRSAAAMCQVLHATRQAHERAIAALLGDDEALPEIDCPAEFIDPAPRSLLQDDETPIALSPSGGIVARRDSSYVRIEPDGRTSMTLPFDDDEWHRLAAIEPAGLMLITEDKIDPGHSVYPVTYWTAAGGEPRALLQPQPQPGALWVTPTRVFVMTSSFDVGYSLWISDDQGRSFRSVEVEIPNDRIARYHFIEESSTLAMIQLDQTDSSTLDQTGSSTLHLLRVDAEGRAIARSSTLASASEWPSLASCTGSVGDFLVVDGMLIHAGDEVRVVHRWTSSGQQLVCRGDRAFVVFDDPTLVGTTCSVDGCDEQRVLVENAGEWAMVGTPTGLRILVELRGSRVLLIDEPPGGPIERVLEADSDPVFSRRALRWDDATFIIGGPRPGAY
ncbi:hypothetical protein ACNOYE_24860 [Nannocystaceae bacterium ST9]